MAGFKVITEATLREGQWRYWRRRPSKISETSRRHGQANESPGAAFEKMGKVYPSIDHASLFKSPLLGEMNPYGGFF
jgi:hypothetical protein